MAGSMLTFVSIEEMRKFRWSKSWLWALRFPEGPIGFTSWFPATDVDEGQAALETYTFQGGLNSFMIPQSGQIRNCTVTFVDTICLEVHAWYQHWINVDILNLHSISGGIATLHEAVKEMNIVRFDNKGIVVYSNTYWVIPNGTFSVRGESGSSSPLNNTLELVICGQHNMQNMYTSVHTSTEGAVR